MRWNRSWIVALLLACVPMALIDAGVLLEGKVFDGQASAGAVLDAMRQGKKYDPSLKSPLAGAEVAFDLYQVDASLNGASGKGVQSWKAMTDSAGAFQVDTALEKWPAGAFILARATSTTGAMYSPFIAPKAGPIDVHLYLPTESPERMSADFTVAYDIDRSSSSMPLIRVRARASLFNRGGDLYVGSRSSGSFREVWRLPFPQGARIVENKGPTPGLTPWRVTADGRSLVVDSPVPGICDLERQGAFEVHYVLPAQQTLVATIVPPLPLEAQRFTAWCAHGDLALKSPQLKNEDSRPMEDPFTQIERHLDVVYSNEPFPAGKAATVVLSADNVAIGQRVNAGAFRWVGGFVLVVVLSIAAGLTFGPRGPAPEAVLESLSGEDVLDRIAALDARHAEGRIDGKDYAKMRESLLELAAEELTGAGQGAAAGASDGARSAVPSGAQEVLRRIEDLERRGSRDGGAVAERVRLLEELLKALRSGGGKG